MEKQPKILVVDDDPVIVAATRRVLESAGYETLGAQDGQEALELTRAQRPDLLLLDVNMPKMDGFETCRRIKADPTLAGTFIIIMSSAHTDSDSQVDGLNMGADGYVSRPVANRELLARVEAVLRIQAVERALQASVAQWSSTFDAVSDAVFLTDANYTILNCNRASAEMWQRPSDTLVGKKCYEVVHGAETPALACPLAIVRETKRRQVITFAQNDRWLEAKVDPMFDTNGNFTGTVHVITDITERKQAEEALRESEDKFKYVFDHSVTGKSFTLASGKMNVNQALCEMLGYSPEELQNLKWQEITHPDDLELTQWEMNALLSGEKEATRFTKRFVHKNGSIVWADIGSTLRRDQDGRPLYFMTTANNITARKQTEEALREAKEYAENLIETANTMVVEMDICGNITVFNQAAEAITGYTHSELQNRNWFEVIVPRDRYPYVWAEFEKLSSGGLPKYFENPILTKTGEERYIVWNNNEVLEKGKIVGTISFGMDITARKQAEKATEQRNQMLLSLHNVTLEMGAELHLPILLESILEHAQSMLDADRGGGIYLYVASESVMQLAQGAGINQGREGITVPIDRGVVGQVFQISQPVIVEDYTHWEKRTTVLMADPPSAVLGVPLFLNDQVIGVLTLIANSHLRKFSPNDVQQAEMFAAQAAIAIQNARLYEQAQAEIAERKLAEEKLKESLSLLRIAEETAKLGGWSVNLEKNRVIWSDEVAAIHETPAGFSPLVEEGISFYAPEWRERIAKVFSDCAQKGIPYNEELEIITARGKRVWVQTIGEAVRDDEGKIIKVHGAFQDISQRKQAEQILRDTTERLAHMLANSPTVIYALKVEGGQANPIWISANIESILGFSAEAGLKPEWWPEQIYPQDRPEALAALEHLLDDFYQHEYRFLRKDGQLIWLHDEHRLLRDANHQPWEIIGAWTDITARKQAEEALKEYNIHLEAAVEERTHELRETQEKLVRHEKLAVLGQMAGSVGHELRNPLGVINSAIYYLKLVQPDATEKVKEYLNRIEEEIQIADRIISDLLDFSRIKSVDVEPVVVADLVRRTLERFPAPENVRVTLDLPEELPLVYVDPRQMTQVLGNLLVNACQAMRGGGQLTVSSCQSSVISYQ